MAKGDIADRLRALRKQPGFCPVWTYHAEVERLPEYDLDKLSCERVVKNGFMHSPEINMDGQETIHVGGNVDGQMVDIVVCVRECQGEDIAVIVTVKPK